MKHLMICLACVVMMISCKSKKKKEVSAKDFFPVTTYLKSELARLDTSLSSFYKIETVDSSKSDTIPIKNSDVKLYAKDFLQLPDITSNQLKNDYEINQLFDEVQDAFIFMFTTHEDHPVKREDVTVDPQPNEQGKNNIRSIFIQLVQKNGDTTYQKNMMWVSGKRFEINTTATIGETEKNKKLQVVWNNFESNNK